MTVSSSVDTWKPGIYTPYFLKYVDSHAAVLKSRFCFFFFGQLIFLNVVKCIKQTYHLNHF